MATETTTLTLPLAHLYYLTADSNNQTGYTIEEVEDLIEQHGKEYQVEATITHPVPDPYTVDGDIRAHEERILNDKNILQQLREQLVSLSVDSEEYNKINQEIKHIEEDIVNCENHISNLKNT